MAPSKEERINLVLLSAKKRGVIDEGFRFKSHENTIPVSVLKLTAIKTYSIKFTKILQSAFELCVENDENHIENIAYQHFNKIVFRSMLFYHVPRLYGRPAETD